MLHTIHSSSKPRSSQSNGRSSSDSSSGARWNRTIFPERIQAYTERQPQSVLLSNLWPRISPTSGAIIGRRNVLSRRSRLGGTGAAVRRAPARPEWSVASDAEGGSGERDGPGRTHLSSRPRRSVGHLQSWRTQKGEAASVVPGPASTAGTRRAAAVAGRRRAAEGFRVSSPPKQTRIPSAASGDQVLDEPEAVHERHRVTVALTCKHGFGPSPAAISVV